jgi:hypothetical protein
VGDLPPGRVAEFSAWGPLSKAHFLFCKKIEMRPLAGGRATHGDVAEDVDQVHMVSDHMIGLFGSATGTSSMPNSNSRRRAALSHFSAGIVRISCSTSRTPATTSRETGESSPPRFKMEGSHGDATCTCLAAIAAACIWRVMRYSARMLSLSRVRSARSWAGFSRHDATDNNDDVSRCRKFGT